MASYRICQLSSSFLRLHRRPSVFSFSPPPLSLCSSHRFLRLLGPFPSFIRLQLFSATPATSAAVIGEAEVTAAVHPWPEWDQFVEKIKSKGYFEAASSESVDDDGEGSSTAALTSLGSIGTSIDTNTLKNACLKFARDRFDILRLLPKEDIKAVVECGCPNLFRKSVNSSKRLRAFLWIDEANVCGACNIRGSCDRAYLVVHEEEGARTLDIMRVLLSYAINPRALLGGETPPVKVKVQESARKILSEIIRLSDTIINPALIKPIQQGPFGQLKTTNIKSKNNQGVEMKFNENQDVEMKRGDWLCPNCDFLNFSRNVRCRECKADGPKRVDSSSIEMKAGDWMCPKCDFMNFARNRKCFRCLEQRPKRDLNPGDWECPECDFLNFSRNDACRKCNLDRPSERGSGSNDHSWRTPGKATKSKFKYGYSEDEITDSDDGMRKEDRWLSSSPVKQKPLSAGKRETPGKVSKSKGFKHGYNEDEITDSDDDMRKEDRWSSSSPVKRKPVSAGTRETPGKVTKSKGFKYGYSEDEITDSDDDSRRKEDKWLSSSPVKRKLLSTGKRETPGKVTQSKEFKHGYSEDAIADSDDDVRRKKDRLSSSSPAKRKLFSTWKGEKPFKAKSKF